MSLFCAVFTRATLCLCEHKLWPCVSLSVCLSQVIPTRRSSIETVERIELILARELPSTYHTLCFNEIRVRYIEK